MKMSKSQKSFKFILGQMNLNLTGNGFGGESGRAVWSCPVGAGTLPACEGDFPAGRILGRKISSSG